jgi:hypothetical protein
MAGLDQSVVNQIKEEEAESALTTDTSTPKSPTLRAQTLLAAQSRSLVGNRDDDEDLSYGKDIAISAMAGTDAWVASSITARTQSQQFADFYRLLSSSFAEVDN